MIATVLVGLGIAILIFVPLERIFPLRRDQRIFRRGWRTDTMHFLVTNQLVQLATIAVVFIPAVSLAVLVRPWLGPLVTSQPWELQLVEAIVIVAFGGYVGHRLMHEVPFLWRFHRVHHSIEEMDWLAASRVNPLDSAFTRAVAVLPLVALGFSKATFGAYLLITPAIAILVHANVRWRVPRGLRWVIPSPEWHHWHHAAEAAAVNRNYSAEFPWIDALLGTAYFPRGERPSAYGLDESEPAVPLTWWRHMVYPFTKHASRVRAPATCGGSG